MTKAKNMKIEILVSMDTVRAAIYDWVNDSMCDETTGNAWDALCDSDSIDKVTDKLLKDTAFMKKVKQSIIDEYEDGDAYVYINAVADTCKPLMDVVNKANKADDDRREAEKEKAVTVAKAEQSKADEAITLLRGMGYDVLKATGCTKCKCK